MGYIVIRCHEVLYTYITKGMKVHMFGDIDHIAYKVANISDTIEAFKRVGIKCSSVETHEEVGLQIAFLDFNNTHMELLEVIQPNSPLQNDGFGYNHIAFKTNSIEETYQFMQKDKAFTVQGEIRRGAKNRRIFFFKVNTEPDLIFECVEESMD